MHLGNVECSIFSLGLMALNNTELWPFVFFHTEFFPKHKCIPCKVDQTYYTYASWEARQSVCCMLISGLVAQYIFVFVQSFSPVFIFQKFRSLSIFEFDVF